MQKIHQTIFINAPREKVWDTMLSDATYRIWTSEFCPGSYFKGNWEQGSKILFLGPNPESPEGEEGGMIGHIAESRKPEFVSIAYDGVIGNGVEDTTSADALKYAGQTENYTFNEKDGGTELIIDGAMPEEMFDMMNDAWTKALRKLKELVETR